MKLSSKAFLFSFVLLLIAAISFLTYYNFKSRQPSSISQIQSSTTLGQAEAIKHGQCLASDEAVDYDRLSQNPAITQPRGESTTTVIFVKNKKTNEVINSFLVTDIEKSGYPIEIHNCGVYVMREYGFDYQRFVTLSDYRNELWRYGYDGSANKILLTAWKDSSGSDVVEYSDFRISPEEKYISLVRGYLGKDNYAIIVKDLNTLQDVFTLPITEIEKRNPDIVDDIELDGWTRDGHYFWVRTHSGANVLGFIRIDIKNWTFEIFPAPKDVLGGDALNIERGLITVHPGNVWYGIADITEQEKAKRRAQGIGTELYIYNLFANEKYFVASTTEPLYYFKPKWLSDTGLQYTLPSGETRIYKVE